MSTQTNLPKTIFEIVKYLCDANFFSIEPDNLALVTGEQSEILPCRRTHANELDLSQLEEAAKTGNFWFLGPVEGITVRIDKGLFCGKLSLGLNKMSYTTTVNTLDFADFPKIEDYLRRVAPFEGLKIEFKESEPGKHNLDLVLTYEASLSVENSITFLDKISKLLVSFARN